MVSMQSTSWTGASFLLYRLTGAFGAFSAASGSAPSAGWCKQTAKETLERRKRLDFGFPRVPDATRCCVLEIQHIR